MIPAALPRWGGMAFEPTAKQRSLLDLVAGNRWGVFVTLRRDGTPQLSNVSYGWDPERYVVRVSVTADRAKTRNVLRDPRASLHVTSRDFWSWTVIDGRATVSPIATEPDDGAVRELIDLYRSIAGEHPDWDDFRAAMVRDRRRVITLVVDHVYGQPAE
jgi:PPOX class probable F420-dependent enzyme